MEEACELRDRRAGDTPVTAHEPLDFRTETVVYDPMVVPDADFSFVDRYPQLTAAEVAAFDAERATALIRAAARDPESLRLPQLEGAASPDGAAGAAAAAEQYGEMKVAERMAVWCRFYKAPRAVQRQMCKHAMGASPRGSRTMQHLHCPAWVLARGLCSGVSPPIFTCVGGAVSGQPVHRAWTVGITLGGPVSGGPVSVL